MSPDWWRYGLFYAPTPTGMQLYRKRIEDKPAEFKKIKKVYEKQSIFELEGDNYKRLFNKDIDKDIIDWYQKKYLGFTSWHDYSEEVFYQSKLTDLVFEGFKTIYPIYKYLDSIE